MSGKKIRRLALILGTAAVVVIACIIGVRAYSHSKLIRYTYQNAGELMAQGAYGEAADTLYTLLRMEEGDYLDTQALYYYCTARDCYEAGELWAAHYNLNRVESFSHQSEEWLAEYEAFSAEVTGDYEVWLEEMEQAQQERLEERITTGVPFIGMPESRIADTTLGPPSVDIRHNYEHIKGEVYLANLYDFQVNGHTVFTARCVRGEVTEVWDLRDSVDTSQPVRKPEPEEEERPEEEEDPFHAADYSDPEDFYYDYYDDFWEYEDAEEYYYDHQ